MDGRIDLLFLDYPFFSNLPVYAGRVRSGEGKLGGIHILTIKWHPHSLHPTYFSVVCCLLACLFVTCSNHLVQIEILIKGDDSITQEAIIEHWDLILLHMITTLSAA